MRVKGGDAEILNFLNLFDLCVWIKRENNLIRHKYTEHDIIGRSSRENLRPGSNRISPSFGRSSIVAMWDIY